MDKDLKKLRKLLESQGARIVEKKSGWMVYPPDPGRPGVMIHLTSSDHRWLKNTRAELRRSGFDV
ncbi:hypothetical protein [Brachybacterium paraconglomeratum]|uniref:hypothetical protein n=1 Tax=Brachybacterium paraconglomeratum TaxID=173362 RepID=UPI0022AE610C|nr:hypothetical protein [Brachybacterium paraconglomeratum]MCZ4326752.1 hypothetical protein [Brachybacterium paraconglomeratum]